MADDHRGVFFLITDDRNITGTKPRRVIFRKRAHARKGGAKHRVRADSALQWRCTKSDFFLLVSQAERKKNWNVCLKQNLVWQQTMTCVDSRLWAQIYFAIRTLSNIAKFLPEKSSLTYENISERGCLPALLFPSDLHRMKSNVAEFERTKNHAVQLGSQRRAEFSQVISFH